MNCLPLIESKRDGAALDDAAIREWVRALVAGQIPDYQLAALLMAILFRGMTPGETTCLTLAMRDSGEVLHFPQDPRPLVDKHSTGGIGDKVSLPLAPLLACLGFRVPMISGRGLGITGGTLDKLESIPGFTTQLAPGRLVEQVQRMGVAIAGQTETMVPADRILYALRDVTGTVPSIPLITASILSKKLAEGIAALVMDVKFGEAAFMRTREQAEALARTMVEIAEAAGVRTRALLTSMDEPIGRAAGNWLEVCESVACLEGRGPVDLRELVLACAAHLLVLTKRASDEESGRRQAAETLASGAARRKWDEMLVAQGADLAAFQRQLDAGPLAPVVQTLCAHDSGYVQAWSARIVGEVVRDLGGGRLTQASIVDPRVGVDEMSSPGTHVRAGEPLARVHARDQASAANALARLRESCHLAAQPPVVRPRVALSIG